MERKGSVLMQRYEVGRMLGQGTFAKVYHARSLRTGQSVAIKIIDKEKMLKVGLIDQIKREISVMKLIRHPNVVQLYEVMASKTKIYFAMEYVRGGELFNKVVKGKLKEDVARKYFQQLTAAVDFCHSRGVYHRDLKPENLLLDENGDLKVADFGLSALQESQRNDILLHTTCGTPAYAAPEIINHKGYDGAQADIWSCGVILFVLMAGYLPFHDTNLLQMYKKISRAEFKCPQWFPPEVRKLLARILDPNPTRRITMAKIMENSWVKKGYKQIEAYAQHESTPNRLSISSDVNAAFSADCESYPESPRVSTGQPDLSVNRPMKLTSMNAFDIISLSQGFDLSGLFENDNEQRPESRFTSKQPASAIVSKLEQIAETERFNVRKFDSRLQLQGVKRGRKGQLGIDAEIFQIAESCYMVEVKKTSGDTMEYHNFCNKELKPKLKDIVWAWQGTEDQPPPQQEQPASHSQNISV